MLILNLTSLVWCILLCNHYYKKDKIDEVVMWAFFSGIAFLMFITNLIELYTC